MTGRFLVLFLLLNLSAHSQFNDCWKIDSLRRESFVNYYGKKGHYELLYLKAIANKTVYLLPMWEYKEYLLKNKIVTEASIKDTLIQQLRSGMKMSPKTEAFFRDYIVKDFKTYDSLKSIPIKKLVSKFFYEEDGRLKKEPYYEDYFPALILILWDNYIATSYGSGDARIVDEFYIDLLRSSCFGAGN
jgi:hypothetical protein